MPLIRGFRFSNPGGGGGDLDSIYDYPDFTHFVGPSATGSGTGSSESDLMAIATFCGLSTASAHAIGDGMPGTYALDLNVAGGKLIPTNANHSTNRWVFKARNPATTAAVGDSCNFVVNTPGTGDTSGFFGFGNRNDAGLATRNATWDGPRCIEHNGRTNDESASVHCWRSTDCFIRRARIEIAGAGGGFDYNMGCVFAESNTRLWIEDSMLGNCNTGGENGALIIYYGLDGGGVRFSNLYDQTGTGIFLKGQPGGFLNQRTRFNNNDFDNIGADIGGDNSCISLYDATPTTPTSIAECNWVFQNIFRNGQGFGVRTQTLSDDSPRGFIIAQNLAYMMATAGIGLDRFISGPQYDPLAQLWNNILVGGLAGMELIDAGWDSEMGNVSANYTRFHGGSTIISEGGSGMNLATFQSKSNETGSTSGDPLFENAAGGDFRLQSGSSCRNAGTDYLQLLGGAQSDVIHLGPFIASDTIVGRRDA